MTWPTAQDYAEAVQNPRNCFDDPDLKQGSLVTNQLGLPKVVSGQFACVFRVQSSPTSEWAVRCFLSDVPDQQQRYSAISQTVERLSLPCIVSFRYLQRGMRVRGQWYPILRMQWIKGQLLHDYVKDHLNDPTALKSLALKFGEMARVLGKYDIAHGDLQHGNVLVLGGQPVLIDYDGMYVPALRNQASHEIGHRNYQHPGRTEFHFDGCVDRFSLWIICTSLIALSVQPNLWTDLNGGDDALLFRSNDFQNPRGSPALAAMKGSNAPVLMALASLIEDLVSNDYYSVPDFDVGALLTAKSDSRPTTSLAPEGLPEWMSPSTSSGSQEVPTMEGADWLVDHLPTEVPRTPDSDRRMARIVMGILVAIPAASLAPLSLPSVPLLPIAVGQLIGAAACLLVIVDVYRQDPATRARRAAEDEWGHREMLRRQKVDQITGAKRALAVFRTEQDDRSATHARETSRIRASRAAGEAALRKVLEAGLSDQAGGRSQIASGEAAAIRLADQRWSGPISSLRSDIDRLKISMARQLDDALRALQQTHISQHLSRFAIDRASIHGIGEKLTKTLALAGIRTAADATHSRVLAVSGIGAQKASAIGRWRSSVEAEGRRAMPTSVDTLTRNQIEGRILQQVNAKVAELGIATQSHQQATRAAREDAALKLRAVEGRVAALRSQFADEARRVGDAALAQSNKVEAEFQRDIERLHGRMDVKQAEILTLNEELKTLTFTSSLASRRLKAFPIASFGGWLLQQVRSYSKRP